MTWKLSIYLTDKVHDDLIFLKIIRALELKIQSTNMIAKDILMSETPVFTIYNTIAKILKLFFYKGVASWWMLKVSVSESIIS